MREQADPQPHYHLLVVDDDEIVCESIANYLENYHEAAYTLSVDSALDIPRAQECVEKRASQYPDTPYDLVISDINLPSQDGFQFLQSVEAKYPAVKTALMTAYQVEDYIRTAKKLGVYNIIAKTAPFNFEELSSAVHHLLLPEKAWGIASYLEPGTPVETQIITNSDGIMPVFYHLKEFFTANHVRDVDNLATALIEALTNAVYHVSRNEDGTDKYKKGQFIEALLPDEYVSVQYGKDSERVAVCISDQGGKISAGDILYWLDRNVSGAGLLDTHGRGVYLMRTLVDRLVINIEPGVRTEIIVMDYFSPQYSANKPLYINQMSGKPDFQMAS
ncbi:MAG: response regulator [Cyanobacteria bacterium]|nr:response regulator [Cyanobacteriota bacterium]